MPKTLTKMTATDFNAFSGGMSPFYSTLYGTPAAEVAKGLCEKFFEAVHYVSRTPVEEDDLHMVTELNEDEQDPEKVTGYEVSLVGQIEEKRILETGLDQYVNEQLDILEEGVEQGLYPEGSIQRVQVDYMIDSLKKFQRREMFIDPKANRDLAWIPANAADKKFANYVLVPKLAEKQIIKGRLEYVYPPGFAEDNGEQFFIPREDQRERGKYTMEELQESADKVNLAGFSKAAGTYLNIIHEMEDAMTMKKPDPEQETAIRQGLLTSIRYMRQEMQKARRADPADPVARRMFGDVSKHMDDVLFRDRSFTDDIRMLNRYERYLEAGLPLDGYREYISYYETVFNLDGVVNEIRRNTEGMEPLIQAFDLLKSRLEQLPRKGASPEAKGSWRAGVQDAMQQLTEAFHAVDLDNIPFREKTFPPVTETDPAKREEAVRQQDSEKKEWETRKQTIRTGLRSTFGEKEIPAIEGYLKTLPNLGESTAEERRKYLDGVMADMVKDMDDIAAEMERKYPPDKKLPDGLRDAIDKLIDAGKSDNARSPERFSSALLRVAAEAGAEGMTDLANWAGRNRAHFGNRMKQVESKGVLLDESLNFQRLVNFRQGRERTRKALDLFNTGRAFFLKKETDKHKDVREAAEKYMRVKEELLAMNRNGQKGTEAWEKKAQELSGLADEVSRCAMLYINERKMQAKTPAGRDRLNGAVLLYRESEVARITLKKELAANERYRQMAAKGEQLNASISPDPALTDPVGDANVQKMREYMQKELAEEKRLAEEHRKRDKALSGAMDALGVDKKGLAKQALTDQPAKKKAEERRIKETSFEEMSRQLVLVEKKKETVKRKVDAPVGAPAAPQPEGPRK